MKKILIILFALFIIFAFGLSFSLAAKMNGEANAPAHFFHSHNLISFAMKNQKEIWKDVVNYEGLYQVSNFGNVKSLCRKVNRRTNLVPEKIMKQNINNHGYRSVQLCRNGQKPRIYVHRLVASAFIPNLNNKPHINHINGIHDDNNVSNLEWCTPSENELHSYYVLGKKSASKGRKGKDAMRHIPVNQLNIDGSFIGRFEAQADIKRILGIDDTSVNKVINNKRKTAGGYKWEYA